MNTRKLSADERNHVAEMIRERDREKRNRELNSREVLAARIRCGANVKICTSLADLLGSIRV